MKTMIMTTALFSLLCACAIDTDDESINEEETSEISSEITGTVTCTGLGVGSCTASSMPTTWTIQTSSGQTLITPNGLTANWVCLRVTGTRLVTAVGVGTAMVKCSPRAT